MITMGATAQQSIPHEPVPMPGSELRKFHSKIMDQDFRVYVQLPLDYVSDGSRQYPVMVYDRRQPFLPHGLQISPRSLDFLRPDFRRSSLSGSHMTSKTWSDWAAWRTRDFTPTVNAGDEQYWEGVLRKMTGDTTLQVETGGASRFLSFICDELIPYIDSEYPVSKEDRALAGYSSGGLFTMFACSSGRECSSGTLQEARVWNTTRG